MKCLVIQVEKYVVLVEYKDKHLERRYVGRGLLPYTLKGSILDIPRRVLNQSIDYSNVSLVENLGETVEPILYELREHGIWTVNDYKNNPQSVHQIAKKYGSDAAIIISAAIRRNNNGG